jgi:hypothetical protein
VASLEDVRTLALSLPEVEERMSASGHASWHVKGKLFVWERPLRKRDREELGANAPDGPVLGAQVPDLGVKEALLAVEPGVFFTTSHFDGYAMVMLRLDAVDEAGLQEVVTEAWLARAEAAGGRPPG